MEYSDTEHQVGSFNIKEVQQLIEIAKYRQPALRTKDCLTRLIDADLSSLDQTSDAPKCPVPVPSFTERVEFGAPMKEKHFHLDKTWTFINHGAFGACLKEGLQFEHEWQIYCEQQPLKFIDRELLFYMAGAQKRLGAFVDADPTDLAFTPNATTGTCTVVQRLVKAFQPGDSILILNTTYGAVKFLLDRVSKEDNIRVDEVDINFPLQSTDEIVAAVEASLRSDTKLAIFDHVSSTHGIIMPVKKLIDVCHQRGIPVLIDGAHCLGSLPISMREIGADYYVANGHKWLCTPKGCAFLYVAKEHQSKMRPLLVSWGYGSGFNAEFGWTGVREYATYLSITAVLDFWESYGPGEIREYMYTTARDAGKLLTEAWGTSLLADPSLFGTMVLVELPGGLLPHTDGVRVEPPFDDKSADTMQDILHYDYKVEVPVKCIDEKLYVRISAHIYNELRDYQRLAEAVLEQKKKNRT